MDGWANLSGCSDRYVLHPPEHLPLAMLCQCNGVMFPLMLKQASLFGSVVPLESPHLLQDLALITPGLARSYNFVWFYLGLFQRSFVSQAGAGACLHEQVVPSSPLVDALWVLSLLCDWHCQSIISPQICHL